MVFGRRRRSDVRRNSYYNGHGEAQPGSLAYYGGGYWHKFRIAAQESLDPYLFEFKSDRVAQPAG